MAQGWQPNRCHRGQTIIIIRKKKNTGDNAPAIEPSFEGFVEGIKNDCQTIRFGEGVRERRWENLRMLGGGGCRPVGLL